MSRLQELNAKILAKIKEVEEENSLLKLKQDPNDKVKAMEEENRRLKDRMKDMEAERENIIAANHEYHNRYEKMCKLYGNVEEKSEKFIQKNKSLNDLLLNLITAYHNKDKVSTGY